MNEPSGNFELLEPSSPESLVPDSWVETWMVVLFITVALALIAILIYRKKRGAISTPLGVRAAAHAEAVTALDQVGELPPREAAVRSSLIIRKYLSLVARDPALFETHEEYVARHEALKNFSEDAREATRLGFARLAAIKYSPQSADLDTPQVVTGSRNLLKILHHGLRP
jgi:hypothetical protein